MKTIRTRIVSMLMIIMFVMTYIITIWFVLPNPSLNDSTAIIVSYLPYFLLVLYAIYMVPKTFQSKFLKKIVSLQFLVATLCILTLIFYSFLASTLGHPVLVALSILLSVLFYILYNKIIYELFKQANIDYDDYISFLQLYSHPFFEQASIRNGIRISYILGILACSSWIGENIGWVTIVLVLLLFILRLWLSNKRLIYFKDNVEDRKETFKYTVYEAFFWSFVFLGLLLNIKGIAFVLLFGYNFTIDLMKDYLSSKDYICFANQKEMKSHPEMVPLESKEIS